MNFCNVDCCLFASYHVTIGHKCSVCGVFGHGRNEHGNSQKINSLKNFYKDLIPNNLRCTAQYCRFYAYHITTGHKCGTCSRFGHGKVECTYYEDLQNEYDLKFDDNSSKITIECPICTTKNPINDSTESYLPNDHNCSICLESVSKIINFSVCKHACACPSCYEKLKNNSNNC